MTYSQILFFILIFWSNSASGTDGNELNTSFTSHANGMTFVSTIDGFLRAIDPETGVTKWKLKEDPVLRAPTTIQRRLTFIPDPRDGSLYMLVEGHLKKLPYSIPELVNFSPCRSSDGVLYIGNKKDIWLEINLKTGSKKGELSHSSDSSQCPISTGKTTYIGRTVYQLTMFDVENHRRKWNATFADYSSHLLAADVSYPYQHFASSSDGHLLTVDAATGTVLWDRNLGSAIVALYLLRNDGLHKLPYTVVGKETMEELTKVRYNLKVFEDHIFSVKLFPEKSFLLV
uniref:PQQ_3 domain-containing protein n=1 Tax=Syphacia muris TaxID=451379 RepID=A0A0N5AKA9_9BILA